MYRGRLHRCTSERDDARYRRSVFGPLVSLLDYDDFENIAEHADSEFEAGGEPVNEPNERANLFHTPIAEEPSREYAEMSAANSVPGADKEPVLPKPTKIAKPVAVKKLDLCMFENSLDHNTNLYEQTHPRGDDTPRLLVRRGQKFKAKVTLGRPYSETKDEIRVTFETGSEPKVSKGTSVCFFLNQGCPKRKWGSAVVGKEDNGQTLLLELQTPFDCSIGKWRLLIDTQVKGFVPAPAVPSSAALPPGVPRIPVPSSPKVVLRYVHPKPVYVLFNPWSKDDQVYMEDEVELDECVLNNTGKIFNGNSRQLFGRPWSFGQYKPFVLDCALYLLDIAGLRVGSVRGNAINVTRALSAACNQQDDGGVLVGNWSGDYGDGTKPTKWTGSAPILKEFWESKKPVKYGQCWVFSGIITTVCRALGIPARSVTNFSSAHDCDGSMTIDTYWDTDGSPIDYLNSDSVWNFHVWNEAWIARLDLPAGYGGWQAFDATPQETSEGLYRAGPASVHAIKEGQVNHPHDTPFIFAEVNADKVQWLKQDNGDWNTKITKHSVGRRISTHRPRNGPEADNPLDLTDLDFGFQEDPDRLDITHLYKHPEGSEDERAAVYRAATFSTQPVVYDMAEEDVRFEVVPKDNIYVGSPFDIRVNVQNKSRSQRNVHVTLTLTSIYYTGVPRATVKSTKFKADLGPIKSEAMVMRVLPEEYIHHIVDQVAFKISVLGTVAETKQVYAGQDDFRLRRPDPTLEMPMRVIEGDEFKVRFNFNNTMPIHLTQCSWLIEGPGIENALDQPFKDLDPFEHCSFELTMKATEAGKQQVLCTFNTKELNDLTTADTINVLEPLKKDEPEEEKAQEEEAKPQENGKPE